MERKESVACYPLFIVRTMHAKVSMRTSAQDTIVVTTPFVDSLLFLPLHHTMMSIGRVHPLAAALAALKASETGASVSIIST